LSIDHRAVVVLHHYLDLPLDEVAEALGVPVGTVRSRIHHAMRALRASLDADLRPASREVS
jgi:RNA polymerase sigma-70 factor (ECF subfamily)